MPSAKELRDELRQLRKESQKPVSRMRVADVASELEKLRGRREETPGVAATPAHKEPKKMEAKVKDVKEAKAAEFPTKPTEPAKKKGGKSVTVGGSGAIGETTSKPSKKDKLAKLLSMLDSDSE